MALETYGWNPRLEEAFSGYAGQGLEPGRIASGHQLGFRVYTASGEADAVVAGAVYHHLSAMELPTVGDWVAIQRSGLQSVIVGVLPRHSQFVRKIPGAGPEPQVLAANVDTAFLVMGLDDDYNLRRLERYLLALKEGRMHPVVLLNKADACVDLGRRLPQVALHALEVPVYAVSALNGQGLDKLDPYLVAGQTVALVGSSGVGKSTMLNALANQTLQKTGQVRTGDGRGRHTTTHRELFLLPSGALAIDSPGLRELQLWAGSEALDEVFGDITELADACRFGDCSHTHEPGCAVRQAVCRGDLAQERLGSYQRLSSELTRAASHRDHWAQREKRRRSRR